MFGVPNWRRAIAAERIWSKMKYLVGKKSRKLECGFPFKKLVWGGDVEIIIAERKVVPARLHPPFGKTIEKRVLWWMHKNTLVLSWKDWPSDFIVWFRLKLVHLKFLLYINDRLIRFKGDNIFTIRNIMLNLIQCSKIRSYVLKLSLYCSSIYMCVCIYIRGDWVCPGQKTLVSTAGKSDHVAKKKKKHVAGCGQI